MKSLNYNFFLLNLSLFTLILLFSSCGSGSTETTPTPATTYTVTYHDNKPKDVTAVVSGVPSQPATVNAGQTVTPPTPTLEGYEFKGWFTEVTTTTAFVSTTPVTANFDLYAKWEVLVLPTYTVTFHANKPENVAAEVTGLPNNPSTVSQGSIATTPTPRLAGYEFKGWFTEATTTTAFVSTTPITTNINLYAKWTVLELTVTFNYNYSGSPANVTVSVAYNGTVTAPEANTHPDRQPLYTFENWHTTEVPGTNTSFDFTNTQITTNITLYANWTRSTFTVTFNHNYMGAPTPTTAMSNQKGIVTKPEDPTRTDSSTDTFLYWYLEETPTPAELTPFTFSTPITTDITLKAKWTNKIRIIFNTAEGSYVPTQAVDSGEMATKPTPDPTSNRKDYVFLGWYTAETEGEVYDFTTVITAETTIYARWAFKPTNKEALKAHIDKEAAKIKLTTSNLAQLSAGFDVDLNHIDVSLVEDFSGLFDLVRLTAVVTTAVYLNFKISNWNTSSAKNMSDMFSRNIRFNDDISGWNTDNVENMSGMFFAAAAFNQDLNQWNVSKVTDMSNMFERASSFNGNIGNWQLNKVTSIDFMFYHATAFDQNLNNWFIPLNPSKEDAFVGSKLANNLPTWAR